MGHTVQHPARPSGKRNPQGDAEQESEKDAGECQRESIRQYLADEARYRNTLDKIRSEVSLDRAADEMPDLQRDRVIEPHPVPHHGDQFGGGMLPKHDSCRVSGNKMDGERQEYGRQQQDDQRRQEPTEEIARHGQSSRTYVGLKY